MKDTIEDKYLKIKNALDELESKLLKTDPFRIYKSIDYGLRDYVKTQEKINYYKYKLMRLSHRITKNKNKLLKN